jgi:outer membrane protein TolC
VNGQQLFYSFLPGVTAVMLTAQSSWANTAPVGQPELVAFPTSVLSSIYVDKANLPKQIRFDFDTVVAENIVKNTSLLFLLSRSDSWKLSQIALVPFDSAGAGLSAVINPITGIASDSITSSRETPTAIASNTVVTVTNLESRSANPQEEKNILLTIADFYEVSLVGEDDPSLSTAKSKISMNISNIGSKEGSEGVENLDTTSAKKTTPSASLLQQLTITKKKSTPLLTIAEIPANTKGASALMQAQVSQSPIAPNPSISVPSSAPVNRPPASSGPAPSYLNPNPNPLQFPTKPAEVRIQGAQPVTLDQVLELARRNNRDLQTALLQLERSRASLREAQAALFPNLSINSTISRRQSASSQLGLEQRARQEQVFESDALQGDEPSTAFSGQAQLSYNLYTSGSRQARIRQAEEQVRSSEFTVESQSEDVRLNVTRQYYDLQQADEQVRINQSAVVNAQASLRDAVALERAGVGTRFDVLRFQVNLANSQQNLTNSISQQRIAQRQLSATLSITQSVDLIAADPVRLAGLWNQSLEDSIVQALQNRPELQQRLAERNIGEQQRRQALSQLGPQLSLVASYDLLDQFNDNVAVTDGYSVGLQASLNLYEGGAARAQAAQARANIAIAENAFANQRNQVRFEVEQAYSQLQSNLENVQTANTALEQAREALRLARLRFQAGVGTQTDVISAENDLTLSEGNRIQAILNYNRALAAIQRAVTMRGTR